MIRKAHSLKLWLVQLHLVWPAVLAALVVLLEQAALVDKAAKAALVPLLGSKEMAETVESLEQRVHLVLLGNLL